VTWKIGIAGGEDDIAADNRFHATIAQASRNPYFDRFLTFLGANLHAPSPRRARTPRRVTLKASGCASRA